MADLTFILTRTGWLYVAVIMDLYSRRIVGWSMSERQTVTLVVEAWQMALDPIFEYIEDFFNR